jgi:hypothetical protein
VGVGILIFWEVLMKVSELLKLIEQNGWFLVRQRGSHRHNIICTNQEL